MIRIYHNPQCRKSRAGLEYLRNSGVPYEIVEYLRYPLTEKELEKLLVKLHRKPAEVLRTQEEYYKKNLKGRSFNDHELIRIICENPRLLQRPIVEKEYVAVVGDPVEQIDRIIK
jgi:arsenate reductase